MIIRLPSLASNFAAPSKASVILAASVVSLLVGCTGGKLPSPPGTSNQTQVTNPAVLVTSTPGGAKIFLDGVDTGAYAASSGSTPTRIILPQPAVDESVHMITLRLDGYHEWSMFVMAMRNSTVRVDAKLVSVEQAGANGVLRVTSEPEGAMVFIDGKATGMVTPAELRGLSPTRHAIKLELSGIGEMYDFVDIKPGGIHELHVAFDEPGNGSIAGVVYNTNGDTLLDAEVQLIQGEQVVASTRTTLFGTFVFRNCRPGKYKLRAIAKVAGVTLLGERDNVTVVGGRRTFNADVTVFTEGVTGSVYGVVKNRNGQPVKSAYVYALIGMLSAASCVTDELGRYRISGIPAGSIIVEVVASGYLQARRNVQVESGKGVELNFTLTEISSELSPLPNPTELNGTMFTYPASVSRVINNASLCAFKSFLRRHLRLDLIKVLEAAHRLSYSKRLPPKGYFIEAGLWWMPTSREDIAGYAIYRSYAHVGGFKRVATIEGTSLPLFVDISDEHTPLKPVRYAYTLLSVLGRESSFSNEKELVPLGELRLSSPQNDALVSVSEGEQLTFEWQPVDGAVAYWVQLFADFPTGAVDPQWETTAPLKGTSITYDGQPLLHGKTYYWMAIASNSEDPKDATAFSYSELRRFSVR
ncbi:MAG: PEGA domain-containing protein [Armatimonadota bacterium]|nr:PEGA domain-containing protein [Armatimonadota bacterium]MCX7776611.1 PEGA domain-containing protein [Armatimonadota bacterium]MDW8025246.1 PEGA domain-containing protein [Armatimonadota bacterium]